MITKGERSEITAIVRQVGETTAAIAAVVDWSELERWSRDVDLTPEQIRVLGDWVGRQLSAAYHLGVERREWP